MAKEPKNTTTAGAAGTVSTYLITDKAPPFIAGKRVGDRTEIDLTEDQARAEVLAGHLRPRPADAKPEAASSSTAKQS